MEVAVPPGFGSQDASMMVRDRQLPAFKLMKVQHYSFFCKPKVR